MSACQPGSCGGFSSSTMIVMITAITPSVNASSLPFSIAPPRCVADRASASVDQKNAAAGVRPAAAFRLLLVVFDLGELGVDDVVARAGATLRLLRASAR